MQTANEQFARRLEDSESRARRNNIRIIGIPEKSEETATDLFVEDLLLNHLAPKGLSKFFTVERAHRVPGGRPKPGAPPSPIIARIFNFRDRDAILQASRVGGPVKFENTTVSFYPDVTQSVQKQRLGFQGVKRRMRDMDLKYAMLFPARLRVEYEDKAFFFDRPDVVSDWLDTLPVRRDPADRSGGTEDGGSAQE